MLDFQNRVAIITGAGRGVGRGYALQLAARGARVVVNDLPGRDAGHDSGPAHEVVAEIIANGGQAIACEDSIMGGTEAIVGAAMNAFGQIDILINNAGATDHLPFEGVDAARWKSLMEINLMGAVDLCRAALPHLRASGTGKIINTISSGVIGNPDISNYAAGKAGLLGFSRALALEVQASNIHVNCIFPNASTRMQESITGSLQTFLKTHFQAERLAPFVAWLVHQDTHVTAEMFLVGGGQIARLKFAHMPFVRPMADTPEAWAVIADQVMADGQLVPVSTTLEMGMHEFIAVDPNFRIDVGSLLET